MNSRGFWITLWVFSSINVGVVVASDAVRNFTKTEPLIVMITTSKVVRSTDHGRMYNPIDGNCTDYPFRVTSEKEDIPNADVVIWNLRHLPAWAKRRSPVRAIVEQPHARSAHAT